MPRKKRKYQAPPRPPQNGGSYILVETKEGSYWRRKRGTVKKAELNSVFQKHADAVAIASPAAKKIFDKLNPYLSGLNTGRFIANVSTRLKKSIVETGVLNFSALAHYDLQPDHPLHDLLGNAYRIEERKDELIITIPVDKHAVKLKSRLITGYYFDAVLLYGDINKKNGLKTETETSPLYPVDQRFKTNCRLSIVLPSKKNQWVLLLKLSCIEGDSPAFHPKYYGMKVLKTSR